MTPTSAVSPPAITPTTAADELAIHAERALLGEILHESHTPSARHPVKLLAQWGITSSDFYRPYHAQVHAAMLRLAGRDEQAGPAAVLAELRNDPHLPESVAADGVRLLDLMAVALDAPELAVNAAMVAEAAIRRQAVIWATTLSRGSTVDLTALHGQVRELRAAITERKRRWMRLPARAHLAPFPDTTPAAQTSATTCGRSEQPHLEMALLACIARYPEDLDDIGRWLRPEHLTGTWTRPLYQIALTARAHGHRLDPLTLTWLAQRHGLTAEPAHVTALTGGLPWGYHLAHQIHTRALRDLAEHTATCLLGAAHDPALPPGRLLDHATQQTAALQRQTASYLTVHAARRTPRTSTSSVSLDIAA